MERRKAQFLDILAIMGFITLSTIAAFSSLSLLANSISIPRDAPLDRTLRFQKDGTFHISIFEDLHFGEAEELDWGPQQDYKTTNLVMYPVLDKEPSQLVVLNGDLITGENTYKENSTNYVDEVVRPLVREKKLWASTYGNHDSSYNLSRENMYDREQTYPNSLTGNAVSAADSGVTNYFLPVYSAGSGNTTLPSFILYFFDSRGGDYFQEQDSTNGALVAQPNWVSAPVVSWYRSTMSSFTAANNGVPIPSIAFVHIPIYAMAAFQAQNVSATKEPGINDDNPLATQGEWTANFGSESSNYDGQDAEFMSALVDAAQNHGLRAVFSGHDHGDSWCMPWTANLTASLPNVTDSMRGKDGPKLCFGQHSGYGGYGNWIRGSRQVRIREGEEGVETWIRYEDGSVNGRVMLNGTYGQDVYPVVPDRYT
ncbi:hypothetical protein MBLNU457_g2992t1 [Dothideomycetes sp. NU457]